MLNKYQSFTHFNGFYCYNEYYGILYLTKSFGTTKKLSEAGFFTEEASLSICKDKNFGQLKEK